MSDAEVPEHLRLSFLIGEVVRNDVAVESETRILAWELARLHVDSGIEEPERDFGRLIKQVRRGLNNPGVPAPFREIALRTIEASARAHRRRNLLVHDQWVYVEWNREVRSQRSAESSDFSEMRESADELIQLIWRTRAAWVIAPAWLGGGNSHEPSYEDPEDGLSAGEVRYWTRIAMGHIDLSGNQVAPIDGPAPLPPHLA